jgi:superoxide dismutase, Fe-Mn family
MAHALPDLPYPFDALEPHIDRQTMELHHGKHHATYVNNLNAALEKYPELKARTLEELLRELDEIPEAVRTTIRNNGGGHANHSLFWRIMSPKGGGTPSGAIADALASSFGSFAAFKEQFSKAALNRFGSGWAWVVEQPDGRLMIESTANQDTPLMKGTPPLFGLDVWEHAYYLRYQNRRADYISAWWNVVDWVAINKRLMRQMAGVTK